LLGDSTGVDAWVRRARELANEDLVGRLALHVRTLGGSPTNGGVDRQRLQRASTLQGGPSTREILAARDPQDAEAFASQFLKADVPTDLAAYGHRLAAYATAAEGQFRAALRHLDEAQESDVDSDIDVRSLIVATPGSPVDAAVLAQARMAVERWKPSYSHDPDQSLDAIAHSRAHSLVRLHRLGLLALRAGDTAAALKAITNLGRVAEPDSDTAPTARALELSLRARLAAAAGDSARALAWLDQVQWSRFTHVGAAEPLDRLLHADLLAAAGRHADAMMWYSTLGGGAPQELPLVGFAALGMARTSERTGDKDAALRNYRRVVQLWGEADPGLQELVGFATGRIAALEPAPR
jgi:tetratricopeptide (TPR) repeat protein